MFLNKLTESPSILSNSLYKSSNMDSDAESLISNDNKGCESVFDDWPLVGLASSGIKRDSTFLCLEVSARDVVGS